MREGKGFGNPCLLSGYVYLCGFGSLLVEAFAPQTDTFLSLQLQLPENYPCCLYVHQNLLVVHSIQHIFKFSAGPAGHLTKHSQVVSTPVNKGANSQPVVDPSRGLFFLIQAIQVLVIGMETGVEVQSFT